MVFGAAQAKRTAHRMMVVHIDMASQYYNIAGDTKWVEESFIYVHTYIRLTATQTKQLTSKCQKLLSYK